MLIGGLLVVLSAMLAAMGFRGREQVVGIDLGTTFSVVALKSGDKVTVLPDYRSGRQLVPSVVTFLANGTTVVGQDAVAFRDELPLHTIFNAKRFIGRPISEVENDAKTHPYRVAGNSSSDASEADPVLAGFSIPGASEAEDRWVSPIEVGAEVVRQLKRSITEHIGYPIKRAVICVPAKFSARESKATQDAFEAAGFKVARVLEEPTAAAVAYNLHKGSGTRNVLVYDIGGGTLDTSLLFMNGRSVSVLGVAGDDHLGGSDFDQKMREVLAAKLPGARSLPAGAETPKHRCHSHGLLILGEEAKIALSSQESVVVECLAEDGVGRSISVARAEFEEACSDLFARSMAPVEKVLEDQMMTSDNVDDVVLVGGASRTPRLRKLLQEFIGPDKKLHTEIDPDVTVAYGAANIVD